MLNSVVKISMMSAKYFEFYTIILRGAVFSWTHCITYNQQLSDNYGVFGDRHIRWKPDRNVPLLEMNTLEYVIPWDCLLLQTASIITGFYSQKKHITRRIISYQYDGITDC